MLKGFKQKLATESKKPRLSLKKKIKLMKVEGAQDATITKPVTIQLLKNRSELYRKTPSIDYYIDSVLDQQKETQGLTSIRDKLKNKFVSQLKICEKLE